MDFFAKMLDATEKDVGVVPVVGADGNIQIRLRIRWFKLIPQHPSLILKVTFFSNLKNCHSFIHLLSMLVAIAVLTFAHALR